MSYFIDDTFRSLKLAIVKQEWVEWSISRFAGLAKEVQRCGVAMIAALKLLPCGPVSLQAIMFRRGIGSFTRRTKLEACWALAMMSWILMRLSRQRTAHTLRMLSELKPVSVQQLQDSTILKPDHSIDNLMVSKLREEGVSKPVHTYRLTRPDAKLSQTYEYFHSYFFIAIYVAVPHSREACW